jgi:hypothetical protein
VTSPSGCRGGPTLRRGALATSHRGASSAAASDDNEIAGHARAGPIYTAARQLLPAVGSATSPLVVSGGERADRPTGSKAIKSVKAFADRDLRRAFAGSTSGKRELPMVVIRLRLSTTRCSVSKTLNSCGEKTRPGQCPEQQLIAPAPVDDK